MSRPLAPHGWERDVCCGGSWEGSFSTPNSFLPLLPDVAVSQDSQIHSVTSEALPRGSERAGPLLL